MSEYNYYEFLPATDGAKRLDDRFIGDTRYHKVIKKTGTKMDIVEDDEEDNCRNADGYDYVRAAYENETELLNYPYDVLPHLKRPEGFVMKTMPTFEEWLKSRGETLPKN